jgi:hypothetical protein
MIKVTLKSVALSAICGAFLSAVTAGAVLAGGEVKKFDPDCIKKCNDAVDACIGNAHSAAPMRACKRTYSNCVGNCKF